MFAVSAVSALSALFAVSAVSALSAVFAVFALSALFAVSFRFIVSLHETTINRAEIRISNFFITTPLERLLDNSRTVYHYFFNRNIIMMAN